MIWYNKGTTVIFDPSPKLIPFVQLEYTVAYPGFPVGGGVDFAGGRGLLRWLRFKNFVCQNERI